MTVNHIGERLRHYRHAARKTLSQVAQETGLTASFLSQAERNLTGISLSSLANIARSLNITVNTLFSHSSSDSGAHDQRQVYIPNQRTPAYERLTTHFPDNQLHALKMMLPARYRLETVSHDGTEFVYVLKGQIGFELEGKHHQLNTADSLHFDAKKPHRLYNCGDHSAEILIVTTALLLSETPK